MSAEELKGQLAESGMANAIPEMVKAAQDIGMIDKTLGVTEATKAFFKLQEQGKVITSEILPRFAERLKEVASVGLEDKLQSNTVAMQRFTQAVLPMLGNEFFKAGFGDGFTSLLNQSSESLIELIPLFKSFGRIIGSGMKLLSGVIKTITPVFRAIGDLLNWVTEGLGDLSYLLESVLGASIVRLLKKIPFIENFFSSMRFGFASILAPITAAIALLWDFEELMNKYVWKDKIGIKYDPRFDPESEHFDKTLNPKDAPQGNMGRISDSLYDGVLSHMKGSLLGTPAGWAVGKAYDYITSGDKKETVTIQNNIILDGNQIAESVTTNPIYQSATQKEMYTTMYGG